MKRHPLYFIFLAFLFCLMACGKKGPLQPPIVRVPKKAEILELTQRGDKVILKWKNPTLYIDGNPVVGLAEVEIWILEKDRELNGAGSSSESAVPDWEKEFKSEGRLLNTIVQDEMADYSIDTDNEIPGMQFAFPLDKGFLSKKYYLSVRVRDIRRRKSDYSDPLSLEANILPLPPQNIGATVLADRIVIQWEPPGMNIDQSTPPLVVGYNIYRSEEQSPAVRLNSALITEQKYEDKAIVFGTSYHYHVRASAAESLPYQESVDSEQLQITPEDAFPPEPPKGLVVVAGGDILSLSWDANQENDMAGYRVWRKADGESEFVVLTEEPIGENTFTDTMVEKNTRYHYAITSLDRSGNESEKSKSISEIIRDDCFENLPF